MSIKYIIFNDRSAEAEGLVALARKTRVDALPGGVYRVCDEDLAILRDLGFGFRITLPVEQMTLNQQAQGSPSCPV